LLWRLTQSGRYSALKPPTTATPPQKNHPPSPLMRLIASRHGPFMDKEHHIALFASTFFQQR
jgi:hypothetical protein